MAKECELYDRICIKCGECEFCDLDSKKKCNNCNKCLDNDDKYRTVNILRFISEEDNKK